MGTTQFVRCQAYTTASGASILSEADRVPGFTSHVEKPETPTWYSGSRRDIELAITSYMSKPAPVRAKNGAALTRKRRADHRCLVAGVVSWPDTMALLRCKDYPLERRQAFKKWLRQTQLWLLKQYGDKLVAVCLHLDESHPHLHFFLVGDAQRLHPGMKNELVNDQRLVIPAERFNAHKAGLREWLNDFHSCVAQPCGLLRNTEARKSWRIPDRATRRKLEEIDKLLAERPNPDIQERRDELWDSIPKIPRPRMVF